ncbi:DgyrCDS6874 [Dimorphilus gyrociliatus]|uniref:MICOS complex subunit MIC60 n=1 Tax=Dimorphilus gyrociliatus TaxID=2664684 RepID=A0A7I8VQX2_9ANNE|nr:DgyrCDS6874 [Dimorphilus gyrociliatus]
MPKLPWQNSKNKEDLPPEKGLAKVIRPDMSQIKEETPKLSNKIESSKTSAKTSEVPPSSSIKIKDEPKKVEKRIEKKIEPKQEQTPAEVNNKVEIVNQTKDTELDEAVENAALTSVIKLSLSDARKTLEETVLVHKKAVAAIKDHNTKLRKAMELDSSNILEKDSEWKSVTEAYNIKKKRVEEAEALLSETKAVIEKIELQIDDGKSSKLTKKNKVLSEAVGEVSKFKYELGSIREELKKTVTDDNILKEYHDLVTASKKQFRDEVEAVTPGLRISRKLWEKMSMDEMHLLLAHSYRRVEQLQEQLAQQQVTEVLRIEEALDKQKISNNDITKKSVERERELLLKEKEREKENWVIDARVQFENELREQLNRQASIHGDHMAEILKLQGFFLVQTPLILRCHSCGIELRNPAEIKSFSELIHLDECKYSNDSKPKHIPIPELEECSTDNSNDSIDMTLYGNRLKTYSNWPIHDIIEPVELAKCGFFYLGEADKVQCYMCKGIIHQWNLGDTATEEHKKHFPNCPKKELESEYTEVLKERLQKARDDFDLTVAASIGRLRGIEEAVESRSNVEEAARQAQKLWIACQSLVTAVDQPDAESRSLKPDVEAIRSASQSHPFVQRVLASLTGEPVRNENEIRSRFNKVKKICKRVAMLDETGGTLWEYFVSFVQSLFVISASKPMDLDQPIDISVISTFVILDNAKHYMEIGDMETALKFMNQLRGEARNVASDWIKDTRKLLEARQAARVLLAFASAEGVAAKV